MQNAECRLGNVRERRVTARRNRALPGVGASGPTWIRIRNKVKPLTLALSPLRGARELSNRVEGQGGVDFVIPFRHAGGCSKAEGRGFGRARRHIKK
jgi:hypothetical protein